MKNKTKTNGVVKVDKELAVKVKAEVIKKDPANAEEIIKANTTDRRTNVQVDRADSD